MVDVKICEHDGIYTAYHIKIVRGADGRLQEIPTQIHIPIPNANDLFSLREWTEKLTDSQLNVAAQIFYDKWNFSSGDGRNKLILEALTNEREVREDQKKEESVQFSMFNTWPHQKKKKKGSTLIKRMRNRINASGNKLTTLPAPRRNMASRIRRKIKDKNNDV